MSKILIHYMLIFLVIVVIGFLYNRYEDKLNREKINNDYVSIQKYLLNDGDGSTLDDSKPIMWIPIKYEYNSRHWLSFGSRSSFCLNQPYLYLTVRSIIQKCGDSFHICIIDDSSFAKLLPDWSVNMTTLSNPILENMRNLGLARILYKYGGFIVPPSFICFHNLIDLYTKYTVNHSCFVGENIDRNVSSTTHSFYPDLHFMGALKECPVIYSLIEFMQHVISDDFTAQSTFLGDFNRWIYQHKSGIHVVNGKLLGIKSNQYEEPITIDVMFSNNYLDLNEQAVGIYIPADEILNRTKYEWFSRLSTKQVLECNAIICKYILVSIVQEKEKEQEQEKEQEGMQNSLDKKPSRKNWVQFFSTPLLPKSNFNVGQNSGLYMVRQPNMLGDGVPTISNNSFLKNVSTY